MNEEYETHEEEFELDDDLAQAWKKVFAHLEEARIARGDEESSLLAVMLPHEDNTHYAALITYYGIHENPPIPEEELH